MATKTTTPEPASFPLWSDEPATQDLLAFRAVAGTATDALFEDDLDPIAIGLSGAWGSGKTSVLELIKKEIGARAAADKKILIVSTQPWRYDPAVGPKESLIAEVLAALNTEFKTEDAVGEADLKAFKKLVKKVNWSKAIKMTAKTAITMQLPSLDDVFSLVSDDPESLDSEKGMAAFRDEFEALLADPALAHIARVVVLVDDLDRCLPDTVVETLEAIRLFLSAKGMSFIIAADEDRVAEAIGKKFESPAGAPGAESPARLYLHKIVQTTIPLPALSRFDTEAFLFLLLAKAEVADKFDEVVAQCDELRRQTGSLDGLVLEDGSPASVHLVTAARLTPILYEKFHGNPRRIKRFLNDLNVRQAIAGRRGFTLQPDEIAKLMVLERILDDDFRTVLDWLASNQLRDQLEALEIAANGPGVVETEAEEEAETEAEGKGAKVAKAKADPGVALPPLDMHAHIAVAARASDLERLGAVVFAATRSLDEFERTLARRDAVTIWGVGCHPGVLDAQGGFSFERFRSLISSTAFVSEVGLDSRSKVPRQRQRDVFSEVLTELSATPRIVSVHSAGMSSAVLDALSAQPVRGAVLHWWRGSSAETRRAVDLGCWFSVNAENLKHPDDVLGIPIDRLLVETDHPSGDRSSPSPRQPGSLVNVETGLAELFGLPGAEELRRQVWQNFVDLVDSAGVEGLLPVPVGRMLRAARG